MLSAAALSGQTRLDLPTQSKRVDFTQAPATAPVKAGTTPPETCNVGELFYDTDGTPGQNLYGCTALNTWTLEAGSGGGGGASAFNQLTDLKVTLSSNTYTVAAGNAAVGDTTTVFTVATLTETDPDDSGTIYFCLDYNNGNPRLLAVIPVAFTESNYATSGITLLDGAGCPNDSRTLATAAMVNGTPANPVDFRGAIELAPTVIAGTGMLKVNGNSGRFPHAQHRHHQSCAEIHGGGYSSRYNHRQHAGGSIRGYFGSESIHVHEYCWKLQRCGRRAVGDIELRPF